MKSRTFLYVRLFCVPEISDAMAGWNPGMLFTSRLCFCYNDNRIYGREWSVTYANEK